MGSFFGQIGYYLTHPDAVIFVVATALLYPVLFYEVGALLWVIYQAGSYTVEGIQRYRARAMLNVEAAAASLATASESGDVAWATRVLTMFYYGPIVGPVAKDMATGGLSRHRASKQFIDARQRAVRRLDKTRTYVRVGPILGLMGTLIPISPALVALAKGDTDTLSANLVVAFSTTVVGLLIGTIAYFVSVARERSYAQDLSDLEYVLDKAVK